MYEPAEPMSESIGYESLAGRIRDARHQGSDEGRPDAVRRQHDRGKLTARERVAMLADKATFREFGALAATVGGPSGLSAAAAPADGLITGTARVDGRPVVLVCSDFTSVGGSYGETGMEKLRFSMRRARDEGAPFIMIVDGGGHRIQEGLDSGLFAGGSDLFVWLSQLSGWVPLVTVVLGPGFAGPSNLAAFTDFVVIVRGMGTLGMAGPALVAASTGERLTNEELGGADIQSRRGIADLAVDTEQEAIDAVRVFLGYLPSNSAQPALRDVTRVDSEPALRQPVETLVPTNSRSGYDVRTVIDALVDADTAFEIKPDYARNIVTTLTRIGGRPVGVVANQPMHLGGALDSPACEKAAHFIALCDTYSVALLFLIDIPGFLVGTEAESSQLARRSGRLLFELGQATVPRISIVLRKGYGGGYIAMCGGRSFDADLTLAWPTAEISAMPVEGAVDLAFQREIAAADDPPARRTELIAGFRARIDLLVAARGFGIDDVVEPGDTRPLLVETLARLPERRTQAGPDKRRSISPI